MPSKTDESFAEIALAFCKECLGWSNAYWVNDFGYPYISESVSKELADTTVPAFQRHFHYTHLEKVMQKVADWCQTSGCELLLDAAAASDHPVAAGIVVDKRFIRCKVNVDDPRFEILFACLESDRARKASRKNG